MPNSNFNNDIFSGQINLKNFRDAAISSFRDVRAIESAKHIDRFVGVPLTGDSLKHLGILHGDILVVKITKTFSEKNLYVWNTPHGRTAKYAYENFDEIVLHNDLDWTQSWMRNEIEMLGVVVRIERDMEVS